MLVFNPTIRNLETLGTALKAWMYLCKHWGWPFGLWLHVEANLYGQEYGHVGGSFKRDIVQEGYRLPLEATGSSQPSVCPKLHSTAVLQVVRYGMVPEL